MLISPVQSNHAQGNLIQQAAVFIWSEAAMANHAVFSCVDVQMSDGKQRTFQMENLHLTFGKHVL
jgi:hypothetical protein